MFGVDVGEFVRSDGYENGVDDEDEDIELESLFVINLFGEEEVEDGVEESIGLEGGGDVVGDIIGLFGFDFEVGFEIWMSDCGVDKGRIIIEIVFMLDMI